MLSPGERLLCHAQHRRDYDLYIAASVGRGWTAVVAASTTGFEIPNGRRVPVSRVSQFVVSYPNGQIADCELRDRPPPEVTHFGDEEGQVDGRRIRPAQLRAGNEILRVSFGQSPAHPDESHYYSTLLFNVSKTPLRVLGFTSGSVRRVLGTTRAVRTGRRHSQDDFANWYAAAGGELAPGEQVCDPNNHSDQPVAWIYDIELPSGQQHIAGAILR